MAGQLDFLLGAEVTAPRTAAPPSSGFRLPSLSRQPVQRGIPERFNVNDIFDKASQEGASLFATAGQLPSRIYETPVSFADVAARRAFGFSPVDAIGKTPVGGAAGFLGGAIERASSIVPAFINSSSAKIWGAVGDLPDDTEITPELLREKLGVLGGTLDAPRTEGVPLLSPLLSVIGTDIFGRNKTVKEFRDELVGRGFFFDPATGTPIDPAALADDVRSGRKSSFDFGNRAVNDNAMVDLATRIVTDPTNALFFIPGANLAKLGTMGARLLSVPRLIRTGQLAAKAPRAIAAADAIAQGNRAGATLAGLGRVLKGYRKLAVGSSVGNFAINRLSGALPDDVLPFQAEIEEFTKAVEERRPMSGNAAFMLLSAATFPYGRYAKAAIGAQRAGRARVFGVGDMAPLHNEFGGTAKFREEFGGRAGERQMADFIDKQIARDERRLTPKEVADIQSIGDASLRRRIEQQSLERIVDRMRSKGEITGEMRLAKWKEWDANEAGFEGKGIANPFDPTRSARRWRAFEPVREAVDPVLRDTGEAIWGLRDDVVFIEQVDAVHDVLKAARFVDDAGKSRVEVSAILDVLTDHPNINSLDTKGFWARFGAPDAPAPSWDSISRRLSRLRRESISTKDYTNELAVWEQRAPADIEPTTMVPRAQRIEELRGRLAELESQPPQRPPAGQIDRATLQTTGKNYRRPLSQYAPVLYRETSLARAVSFIDRTVGDEGLKRDVHLAETPEMALGQGSNRGVLLEFDTTALEGVVNLSKPGADFAFQSGSGEFIGTLNPQSAWQASVRRVVVDPTVLQDKVMSARFRNVIEPQLIENGWTKRTLDDGRIEYSRPRDTLGGNIVDEHQSVQRELEGLLAEENGIHWARMEQHDKKTGADPAIGRGIDDALDTDPFLRPVRLSPGLDKLPQAEIQRVVALEKELLKINPSYRVKRAPQNQILALVPEDGAISVALRQHTALGEWLHQTGPFSPMSKLWTGLTRKVTRDELATGTRGALMGELIPLGIKPKQAEGLIKELDQYVKDSVAFESGSLTVRWYRDIGSIPPGTVNRIAERFLPAKAAAAINKQGGFYRVLARTGSRYWRSIDKKARAGDLGAIALEKIYRTWTEAPGLATLATTQRVVAKTYYPIFRFILDPRWLGLNAIEANTLMFSKYGVAKPYKNIGEASPAARYFSSRMDAEYATSISPDIGYSLGRELSLLTAKSFDAGSAKSVAAVIDDFGMRDPAVSALRSSLVREAKDNIAKVERQFKDGEIVERTYLAELAKAKKQLEASSGSLAEHVNDTLYRYEKKGVDATVLEEARAILNADELRVMQPLIDRVTEVNRKTWNEIQTMLHGNPARSTMERLANSYWMFWPISYQIKATKWLANIMLNGSFGHNNNALLAGKYNLWWEQHKELLINNPAYAAMYQAQPSLWFAAQMLLPMAPEDIGISLSKPASLAGTSGQRFLNGWLGTEIGAFTANKYLDDPAAAIGWLTNMGPIYTFRNLAPRIFGEIDDGGSIQQGASLPSIQPIPPTAGGQTPTLVR